MKSLQIYIKVVIILGIILSLNVPVVYGGPQWYEDYKSGLKIMKQGDWEKAISLFQSAIESKHKDTKKQRVGTMFIEYYPHRQMGICYYNLGAMAKAKEQLALSIRQNSTPKAREYMQKINSQHPDIKIPPANDRTLTDQPEPVEDKSPEIKPEEEQSLLVGDRLSIAVLPFETKGIGGELGETYHAIGDSTYDSNVSKIGFSAGAGFEIPAGQVNIIVQGLVRFMPSIRTVKSKLDESWGEFWNIEWEEKEETHSFVGITAGIVF